MNQDKLENLNEALGFLEVYVKDGYVAGSRLTIADHAVIASLSTIDSVGHDLSKFVNVREYIKRMEKEIEGYEELNQVGADLFGAWAKKGINK